MHRESRRRIGGGKDVRGGKDVAVRRVEHHSQDVSKAPALPGLFRCSRHMPGDEVGKTRGSEVGTTWTSGDPASRCRLLDVVGYRQAVLLKRHRDQGREPRSRPESHITFQSR